MELLGEANAIRLRSHEGAYMVAHDDKATVGESDDGSSPNAKWVVERVQGNPNVIRLKSCLGLYLTPSDGKVDWELICDDGVQVKLKSWGDKLLQADGAAQNRTFNFMRWVGELLQGCCQPNSVSPHDPTQNWVFWHVVDLPDASNTLSYALLDVTGSEPNVQVANNMLHVVHPAGRLLQVNLLARPFGQLNGPVALFPKNPRPPEVSNPFGQTNA